VTEEGLTFYSLPFLSEEHKLIELGGVLPRSIREMKKRKKDKGDGKIVLPVMDTRKGTERELTK